jgi:endonuclease/exonuclease/phosphatase family metal-dependent hydrolase
MGEVVEQDNGEIWHLAGVYGFPDERHKKKTWDMIKDLRGRVDNKWLCLGDFNDILAESEKKGGNRRSFDQLRIGRRVVDDCNLIDMGFLGYPFTWSNGREGADHIQCRLDRALASEDFINRFSPTRVTHLPRYGSDHSVLLIELEVDLGAAQRKKVHLFRFEKCWSEDNRCE